jgi:DNA-directed RNA polymerase sigma subunit (sigma70/sigma32)
MQLTLKHSERAALWNAGLSSLEASARQTMSGGRACPACTSQQIADACGTSRQAVDKIVANALLKLRKRAKALKHELA